jgi:hypothetical protein
MRRVKRSFGKRGLSVLLALSVLWAVCAVAFAEDDEAVKRTCEQALVRCLGDSVWSAFFSNLITTVLVLEICLVGYEFCERYIAPLIK